MKDNADLSCVLVINRRRFVNVNGTTLFLLLFQQKEIGLKQSHRT